MRIERRNLLRIVLLLGVGLLLGAGIGLFLGWVVWPLEFTDADPSAMEEQYQTDYALMIATAYANDGDLAAARSRLRDLDKENPERWILRVTVDYILNNEDEDQILRFVNLTNDLGQYSPIMEPYLQRTTSEGGT